MKRHIARLLRRAANRLDPIPPRRWLQQHTTSSGMQVKVDWGNQW